MIKTAFVNIWNKRVGAIAWNPDTGLASFEYDVGFLKSNLDLSPVKMPLSEGSRIFQFPENRESNTFKGLPGMLADILPDKYGNALINAWLIRQNRPTDSLNPVETLCFIGARGMGALEFEPIDPIIQSTATKIELDDLISIAEHILSGRKIFVTNLSKNEEKALLDILKVGTSAGGARAKALIAYNEKTNEIRSGQANAPEGFTHYLIKFDGVQDAQFGSSSGYGRVEMAYYEMATAAGINMMESRLIEENGRAHFITKRYDRIPGGEKMHAQTFCAMRHYDFNEINLYSYEALFETMRILGLTYPEAEQMFRRMVFNVMSRNCDDHTKNFSFLMDKNGKWSLSPAYDICHAYRPNSTWVSQHCLSVNGKRKNITRADFIDVAKRMNIKKPDAVMDDVALAVSKWAFFAKRSQVDPKLEKAIAGTLLVL